MKENLRGLKEISKHKILSLDIDRGFVSYGHDHSDTESDTFGVAIFLEGDKRQVQT